MRELPSRQGLAALREAAHAVVPVTALGFARRREDGRLSVLYSYAHGIGEFVLGDGDLPEALRPGTSDARQADDAALQENAEGAFQGLVLSEGARRVVSVPVPGEPATRLWVATAETDAASPDRLRRLGAVAETSAGLWDAPLSSEEVLARLRRLDRAADMLPALLHALDVREVFEPLSVAARQSLPHDVLLLVLFKEGLSRFAVFARSDRGFEAGPEMPSTYPAAAIQAWEFAIVDDHTLHPLERDAPATKMGMRSSLRFPVRFDDRVIGGVGFLSREPFRYTTADVAVGRRLADHVAVALSHHELAERLAEEARRRDVERARTANLELLDALLGALIDSGEVRDVFGRVSEIAGKVLVHEAALLMVRLADGNHARLYASAGFQGPLPETAEIPEELLANPEWEHDIFDDLSQVAGPRYARLTALGFQSLLRVPIRFDGRFAGALIFLSRTRASFKPPDILVAHRIADRLAVTLARDRELQASRRADEAVARAARLEARVRALTDELDARTGYRRIVGESRPWRQVLTQATQVASTETTVLLLGESGTGKEVIARLLHRASPRKDGPFIALNCAALPEQLLEAELFGYERGAYTGAVQSKPGQLEMAAGGMLFLDEVGEMSPSAQAKFLRVLQEREFQRLGGTRVLRTDARVVAATNRDLKKAITQGRFREDLYSRLDVFSIHLPALRERRDDILPLSEAFLDEVGRGLVRAPAGISRDARRLLLEYHWPGNVRELRNVLERAAILCDGGLIAAEHLGVSVTAPSEPTATPAPPPPPPRAESAGDLDKMERTMIEKALESARFNKSKAAKALGLTRRQLYTRMRKHGFE
jgi:transcriptional regulator with GAF, ATPase, and Fis domain